MPVIGSENFPSRIALVAGDVRFDVGQITPTHIYLRNCDEMAPPMLDDAVLIYGWRDGKEVTQPVKLIGLGKKAYIVSYIDA